MAVILQRVVGARYQTQVLPRLRRSGSFVQLLPDASRQERRRNRGRRPRTGKNGRGRRDLRPLLTPLSASPASRIDHRSKPQGGSRKLLRHRPRRRAGRGALVPDRFSPKKTGHSRPSPRRTHGRTTLSMTASRDRESASSPLRRSSSTGSSPWRKSWRRFSPWPVGEPDRPWSWNSRSPCADPRGRTGARIPPTASPRASGRGGERGFRRRRRLGAPLPKRECPRPRPSRRPEGRRGRRLQKARAARKRPNRRDGEAARLGAPLRRPRLRPHRLRPLGLERAVPRNPGDLGSDLRGPASSSRPAFATST